MDEWEESKVDSDAFDDLTSPPFCKTLRRLRVQLLGKQTLLSEKTGCSETAISYWETGRRLPRRAQLIRILTALANGGATSLELHNLQVKWQMAMIGSFLRR
jgi:transcriptional regulator with XRE-family HTH domain